MTSLLFLLGLLSVATLFSRRGNLTFVTHIAMAPLLLALGMALSPRALALLTPSTLSALEPALRVGIAWLALLTGLRAGGPPTASERRSTPSDVVAVVVAALCGFVVCAGTAALAIHLVSAIGFDVDLPHTGLAFVGIAVFLGGVLTSANPTLAAEVLEGVAESRGVRRLSSLARREEILGLVAVAVATWLLPIGVGDAATEAPWIMAVFAVGVGVIFALAQRLAGGLSEADGATRHIALLGLITLLAGLAVRTRLPEAAMALGMGLVLARSRQGPMLLERLVETGRPVRLVVTTLIGAHLGLTVAAVLVGLLITVTRLGVKAIISGAWNGRQTNVDHFSAAAGSPRSAIILAASLSFAMMVPLIDSTLLAVTAVTVVAGDLATLLTRAWARMNRAPTAGLDDDLAGGP